MPGSQTPPFQTNNTLTTIQSILTPTSYNSLLFNGTLSFGQDTGWLTFNTSSTAKTIGVITDKDTVFDVMISQNGGGDAYFVYVGAVISLVDTLRSLTFEIPQGAIFVLIRNASETRGAQDSVTFTISDLSGSGV